MVVTNNIIFWMCIWLCPVVRAVTIFRPSRVGAVLCVTLTLALTTLCCMLSMQDMEYVVKHGEYSPEDRGKSTYPMLIFFFTPAIYTISYAWSGRDKKKHTSLLKAYGIFFTFLMTEIVAQYVYLYFVMPYFFLASTSTFSRFLVRMLGQVILLYLGSELSWRLSKQAAEHMGCNIFNATVASFGMYASTLPLLGRIMQGSAETVLESSIYEVAGTVAELTLADSLLKSRTPLGDTMYTLKFFFVRNNNNKVAPALTRRSLTGVDSWQRSFCETVMIMITIAEAAGLLASSFFWLVMDANPSEPGSPKIPTAQILKTLAIMLVGELVVTDGIIAYVSNKFKKRYIVDLAAAWQDLRTNRKKLIWTFVAIVSMMSIPVINTLPGNMCYTSPVDDEANWAVTSCPDVPKNITEMSRVSLEYQAEWEKYN